MEMSNLIIECNGGSECVVNVSGPLRVADIEQVLKNVATNYTGEVLLNLAAASGSDYLLVQLLALLRKEGHNVHVNWTDHKPSNTIHTIIETLLA